MVKPDSPSSIADVEAVLRRVRACRICANELPLGPRPVLRVHPSARVLIAGQAPGRRVHETGIPWNDPSGDCLREWLQLDRDTFYDATRIAIIPAGLCYPGTLPRGGDLPPRPECGDRWLPELLPLLPCLQLTIAAGAYAQCLHLGDRVKPSLTETVASWREYAPAVFPLPHPSFRNLAWMRRNPWFASEVLPALRHRLHPLIDR